MHKCTFYVYVTIFTFLFIDYLLNKNEKFIKMSISTLRRSK